MFVGQGEFTAVTAGRAELLSAVECRRKTESLRRTIAAELLTCQCFDLNPQLSNNTSDSVTACLLFVSEVFKLSSRFPPSNVFPRREAAVERSAAIFGPAWEWDTTILAPQILRGS
ncbi:Hypothetical predicted protein [Xyrichtys novacula]|uniref:Uncharacterized protein n=1 Tax=Xyrichtys novacula TaxID=13765 RepID=A0AAV1FVX1_XYRNO|nr:Hypothetical predicted protein [Xyrichtys novacula]